MSLTITLASTPEQREAVFRLRYTVLVEEAQMSPSLADHQFRCIEEPLDATARLLVARYGETVVGALRVNLGSEGDHLAEATWFQVEKFPEAHPPTIAFTTPPLVVSGFRTSMVPLRLMSAAYGMNLDEGITHDFTACGPDQEPFFQQLGYRPYCGRQHHPDRGDVQPMVLVLRDRDRLEMSGSPLAARLREHRGGRPTKFTPPDGAVKT